MAQRARLRGHQIKLVFASFSSISALFSLSLSLFSRFRLDQTRLLYQPRLLNNAAYELARFFEFAFFLTQQNAVRLIHIDLLATPVL